MRMHMRTAVMVLGCMTGLAQAGERPCSVEQLSRMSWCELEQLYAQLPPGQMPSGFLPGKSIYCSRLRSCSVNLAWKGKHFCAGTMVNQWACHKAVDARVYLDKSWCDGKPAIVLDYRGRCGMWSDVRDEIREVCPGVYLGMMYRDTCTGPKRETFFALGCK